MKTQNPNESLRPPDPEVLNILNWPRWRTFYYGGALVVASVALLFVWPGLAKNLLATGFNGTIFIPHGHCYLWVPALWSLHVSTDFLIGTSYVAISLTLAYLVYQARRDIPFSWIFLAFGLFIIACGATHFMEVWTLWTATYWLAGYVKLITAVASLATAVVLPPLVPKTLALIRDAKLSEERRTKLETANRELESLYEKTKELDRLKTQFFANVSHELRTPLALILGPTERLQTGSNLHEDQRKAIEIIDRNARSLLKHVNDLLDISKLEAGRMHLRYAQTDLARLTRFVASHFEGLAAEKSIRYRVEAPEALPAQVDAEKCQRILLNLLSNAFKFTPTGGTIQLSLRAAGDRALLEVRDNGPGVPAALREIIFEPFRQVEGGAEQRHGGTGLGLSIVKEFVDLHGGAVEVAEALGGGALFTAALPLTAPEGADLQPAPDTQDAAFDRQAIDELRALQNLTATLAPAVAADAPLILVVEDNPDMNAFVAEALGRHYRVATAFDGQEGLNQALALRPDLIISDVMMPRLSGDQMVEAMRRHPEMENLPIVMLTAKADDALRVELLKEGVQDYLNKPFSVEELLARVGRLVTERQRTDEVLRESEARLRAVLEHVVDAVITIDERGIIQSANPAAERLFGHSAAELQGQNVTLLMPELYHSQHDGYLANYLQTGQAKIIGSGCEVVGRRKDGSTFPIDLAVSEFRLGNARYFTGLVRDITERKAAEAQLKSYAEALVMQNAELQRSNQELDDFAYIASHDLKEPLRGIHNYATFLIEDYGDKLDADGQAKLETVKRLAQRLETLIDSLLAFSRVGGVKLALQETDLNAIVAEVLDSLAINLHERGVEVRIPERLPSLRCDRVRVAEVFRNLITNAMKYNDKPKKWVEIGACPTRQPQSGQEASPGEVALYVRDNGIGIREKHLETVFRIFKRLHARDQYGGGTGAGLTIAKKIVERHGGRIWIESEPGEGSTFYFTLASKE